MDLQREVFFIAYTDKLNCASVHTELELLERVFHQSRLDQHQHSADDGQVGGKQAARAA